MKFIPSLLVISCLLFSYNTDAQPLTAMEAYDSATYYRTVADSLWRVESPQRHNLLKALSVLNDGLRYLDAPAVHDLAEGHRSLKYRRFNILNDKAHVFSLLREKDSTVRTLKEMQSVGGYHYDFIEKDTAFALVRNDGDYQSMMAALRRSEALWEGKALKTPYQADLPMKEKIAGLSLLWSQAKYNFVHFDGAAFDWNQHYMDHLDQVLQTKSTADYYEVLVRFYASLKDGHTNVYFPKELSDQYYARPPFRTDLIEGRVFVTEILGDTIRTMGIEKGLEILSINKEPVLDYARKHIEPYQSSSTAQDLEVRKFTYALLTGSKDVPLLIRFRDRKGKEWEQSVPRGGYGPVPPLPVLEYREIGDIGYLQLNSFDDPAIVKMYDSVFPRFATSRALIVDLRKNGGGNGDIGFRILSTLSDAPFALPLSRVTQYNSNPGGDAQWYSFAPAKRYPSKKLQYAKPVIVLIGPRTFSAAEDFVVAFSNMKRGKLVGQSTGGSTGQPFWLDLPGGGTARVCAKDDRFPDGRPFVGIGITPDVYVGRKITDLYRDQDAVLAKALELLRGTGEER